MSNIDRFKSTRDQLNEVSPSFCLAKWLQVTIHLQNGLTHSCHHPVLHKVPLDEVAQNPSALHNTKYKMKQRKKMLEGLRPSECDYCWRIEDASPDNYSDRAVKSADPWAAPHMEEVKSMPWDHDVVPTYVEVSFGNECQFKCAYCSPVVSSGILAEHQKSGNYQVQPYFNLDMLKKTRQYPYGKDEHNPYVEAFWKWWPTLSKKLEVFRITGGEPLLNPNTFQFLERVIKDPMPKLEVAVNSNLSVPDVYVDRFISLTQKIVDGGFVKKFEIYTSIDTHGEQAEYIRNGLDSKKFYANVRKVLDAIPGIQIVFMCTFNALSVFKFEEFLKEMAALKKEYPHSDGSGPRVLLSTPYLRYPGFMAANILPEQHITYVERALDYMLRNANDDGYQVYKDFEISQFRRILEWLKNDTTPADTKESLQKDFYLFFKEYDQRKGTDLRATFPELVDFVDSIEKKLAPNK